MKKSKKGLPMLVAAAILSIAQSAQAGKLQAERTFIPIDKLSPQQRMFVEAQLAEHHGSIDWENYVAGLDGEGKLAFRLKGFEEKLLKFAGPSTWVQ